MSRIGNSIINLPSGIEIDITKGNLVTVKGPKGQLTQQVDPDMKISVEDGSVKIDRPTEQKRHKAMHGLYNALMANMVVGVSEGYTKELELIGVGFRATNTGNLLELALGFSHPIIFYIPDEVNLETEMAKGKSPKIRLSGINKQLVGQVAAKIRSFRKPEPYKGKGIRYVGEEIRRKAGKTAAK